MKIIELGLIEIPNDGLFSPLTGCAVQISSQRRQRLGGMLNYYHRAAWAPPKT
jgi:hypothetical protein